MQNKVLNGLIYELCEIYIDDVLIHGKTDPDFLEEGRCQPQKNKAGSQGGRIRRSPRLKVSATFDSKGDAPIHRSRELLPRSCTQHDRDGKALARNDTSGQVSEV